MASCRESELLAKKKELVNDHIFYLVLKRLMDIVGASLGLVLASPIMLIVAILIKLILIQDLLLQYPSVF